MRVKMINSVDEYVAGQEYDLDDETSDRFLVMGYAEGEVADAFTPEEWEAYEAEERAKHQTVGL